MKVYVTQYALTKGILEKHVDVDNKFPNLACDLQNRLAYYHKPYWHENYQDAVKHAQDMQTKKIKSLQKQLEKVCKIKF